MLRTRLITAAVLIPLVAWLIYLGGLPFFALVWVLATIAEIEFSRLLGCQGFQPVHLFGLILVWLFLLDANSPSWDLLRQGLAGILLLSISWQVLRYPASKMEDWTGAISSGVYIGICASYLLRLRSLPADGLWWTLTVVPVALVADSAAYVAGTTWGRRKLAPRLSSGKTLEGYAAGILASALVGGALGWLWGFKPVPASSITWPEGALLGVAIAALTPIGDLAISIAKREAGVKDCGTLLPGHGGVLDRLDTVLFAAVIGHMIVTWLAG